MGQVQLIVDEPNLPESSGRDSKGRFAPGNKLSPKVSEIKSRYISLRNASLRAIGEQDIEEIVQNMVRLAKNGDMAATRLLFQFVISHNVSDQEADKHDDDMNDVPIEYTRRLQTIHPNLFRITNGRDHTVETSP
jgi:hypothetical protein